MDPTPLATIARWCGAIPAGPTGDPLVHGVEIHGARSGPGTLYAALRGRHADGHAFVSQAALAGAAAALVERPTEAGIPHLVVPDVEAALADIAGAVRRASPAVTIVITGSAGKTTTKGLLASVLSAAGPTVASPASFNNHQGVPLTLLGLRKDTAFGVIEVGANAPGEVRRLARLARPTMAVVTSVGPAHIEGFGSLRGVLNAKAEVLEALPPDGTLIIAADDPRARRLATRWRGRTITCGETPDAEVHAVRIARGSNGTRIILPDRTLLDVPFAGLVGARAALLALGVTRALGLPTALAARAIAGTAQPPGRLALRSAGGVTIIDDSYNANPASTAAGLHELATGSREPGGRLAAILGDHLELGPRSARWHRWIGSRTTGLDLLVVVGSRAQGIAEGARRAGLPGGRIRIAADPDQAIAHILPWLRPGDRVLVKGSRAAGLDAVATALANGLAPSPPRHGRLRRAG